MTPLWYAIEFSEVPPVGEDAALFDRLLAQLPAWGVVWRPGTKTLYVAPEHEALVRQLVPDAAAIPRQAEMELEVGG